MSLDATRWAWAQKLRAAEKLVLLALADRANRDGECWPSISAMVRQCGLSRRAVYYALTALETVGLIRRQRQENYQQGNANHYRLDLDSTPSRPSATDAPGLVQNIHYPSATDALDLVQGMHTLVQEVHKPSARGAPQSIREPIIESNTLGHLTQNDPAPIDPKPKLVNGQAFEAFWSVYPKKRKKKTANGIWDRKKLANRFDTILADIQHRQRTDRYWQQGYIPDPTTYLSQERWDDEITTERAEQKRERTPAEILYEGCKDAYK